MIRYELLSKKRLFFLLLFFNMIMIILIVRVFSIQVIKGDWYRQKAYENRLVIKEEKVFRGSIFDTNGALLAKDLPAKAITMNPKEVLKSNISVDIIIEKLTEFLNLKIWEVEELEKKIRSDTLYQQVITGIDTDLGERINTWLQSEGIRGIYVIRDLKRDYPQDNLASHIIGFIGTDRDGLNGIELSMNQYLKGNPGKVTAQADVKGNKIPFVKESGIKARNGFNINLTIDMNIQNLTEKALEESIRNYKVERGGVIIVMNPKNGDILALASKPDFDLNNPFAPPDHFDPDIWNSNSKEAVDILSSSVWRNKAVSDTYEPGSTFKLITAAAGLEEGIIQPDSIVDGSPILVSGWKISDWDINVHEKQLFAEAVYNSTNPVFVRLAQELGNDIFYRYIDAFGFNNRTNLELPGEEKGYFQSKPSLIDMSTASFGQRFTITPIQLITAYSAIANGGSLMKPRLIKSISDEDGSIVKYFKETVIRKVISTRTSQILRNILEGAVLNGTGARAFVEGYRIAGKTGTSETLETKTQGRYIASFAGFAPADDPIISILVILDFPKGDSHSGGTIAAPVAGQLFQEILDYMKIEGKILSKLN